MKSKLARDIVRSGTAYRGARTLIEVAFGISGAVLVVFALMAVPVTLEQMSKAPKPEYALLAGIFLILSTTALIAVAIIVRSLLMAIFDLADAALAKHDAFSAVRDEAPASVSTFRSLRH